MSALEGRRLQLQSNGIYMECVNVNFPFLAGVDAIQIFEKHALVH
jgi:hypothetical protein